jgi:hypothetical protein
MVVLVETERQVLKYPETPVQVVMVWRQLELEYPVAQALVGTCRGRAAVALRLEILGLQMRRPEQVAVERALRRGRAVLSLVPPGLYS